MGTDSDVVDDEIGASGIDPIADEEATTMSKKWTRKEAPQRDEGFTLVELLVVITIMGVLSTVSVFAVRGITDKGQQSACESDKRVLEVAVETWFADESVATSGTLSEQGLVTSNLLRAQSDLYNVQADGSVVATAGKPCVSV